MKKQTKVVSLINVALVAAGIIDAYAFRADQQHVFTESDKDAWKTIAQGFKDADGGKQVSQLHDAVMTLAIAKFEQTTSGPGKTVRGAADVCRLALRNGVALFDEEGKVRGRTKVQTECAAALAAKAAKKGADTPADAVTKVQADGTVPSLDSVRAALQWLVNSGQAEAFGPEILAVATAANMRVMTPDEVQIVTGHYLSLQKVA